MTDSTEMRALDLLGRLRAPGPLPSLNAITRDRRAAAETIEALLSGLAALAAERDELARQLSEADAVIDRYAERFSYPWGITPEWECVKEALRRHAARQPAAENKEG